MQLTRKHRIATYLSVAVIVAFWLSSIRFFGAAERPLLTLSEAFLSVMIKNTIIIGLITTLMRLEGDGYVTLGFSRKRLGKQVLMGMLLGSVMLVFGQVLVAPIVSALIPGQAPVQITEWFQKLSYIPMLSLMILYGAGIGEELTRVFMLTRLEKLWGRPGMAIAIVGHAVSFGIAHLYQGTHVAISLGISSVVYSLIFVRRRSALELIVAHITFDVIGVTLGFFLYYKG